ncbi:MAG: long-chain fatty acid--CoA ligase [Acidobacteriota bacterium]
MYKNLSILLAARAEQAPDKTFLTYEPDGRTYTYCQFQETVNQTANLLHALGITKGDRVSLLLPNCPEYVISYFACFQLGALAGPINALLKSQEIKYVLNNSESIALIIAASFLPYLDEIRTELPFLKHVIVVDATHSDTIYFPEAVAAQRKALHSVSAATSLKSDDEAIIIYTSGTTGKPKGVLLTHGNLIANARQISSWLNFTAEDRLLCIMPLFHMNAVSVTTMTPFYVGASMILSPKFSATKHWQIISDYRITSFGSVATMLSMLLHNYPEGVPAGCDTAALRFAMCGSAPVPVEVIRQFEELFHCLVIEGYGLSESTCRSTFNPPDTRRRPGSIGLPIGNEMKIFDENDNELGAHQIGEIVLCGENIMKGYFHMPTATKEAFRNGWFHTGDVGYYDEDGYFFVVDRKSDMIIRGGENIYPREIDELLYQHPAVKEAATIGVPDPLYGEEVKAFVTLKEGAQATAYEIIAFCRTRLADYKCPKSVVFLPEIPKGPTGKLLKRELARWASSEPPTVG